MKLSIEQLKSLSKLVEKLISENADPRKYWVWIEFIKPGTTSEPIPSGYFRVQHDYTNGESFQCGYPGTGYCFEYKDYGITWEAYPVDPKYSPVC
jgi:hypothetical protein